MKSSALLKAVYKDCLDRGYVADGDKLYPPNHPEAIRILESRKRKHIPKRLIKTGWIDDERNIRNKEKQRDAFMMFIEQQLGVEVWPEFYFSTERQYRFDYAIPKYKIAIEQEGGIWMKGNSGHSSGTGIQRDMDKISQAAALGWRTMRVTPSDLMTEKTIELIRQAIINK